VIFETNSTDQVSIDSGIPSWCGTIRAQSIICENPLAEILDVN